MDFYKRTIQESFDAVSSQKEGLTSEEAKRRIEQFGKNRLSEARQKSGLQVFFEQFKDLLVIILIIAAMISMITGNSESTIVIIVVLIINAILGTVQHFKAEQSLSSLRALSSPTAKVIRDGQNVQIPSEDVVIGDILMLEAGDLVVADGRIIDNFSLQVQESALTGESQSVDKSDLTINGDNIALGDRINMVYSGSLVTYGRAQVLVTGTAMTTEIGKIADLLNQTKEKRTPLQENLDDFSKKLSIIIMIICAVVFVLGMVRQMPVLDSLMFAVALAVAAIPEALSSIVTIALALGTQKMANENAIIKKLKAVEGLGCVSIICSDKTGTLTQNKMTVQRIYAGDELFEISKTDYSNKTHALLLLCSLLCNDSYYSEGKPIGDPTEIALLDYYAKLRPDAYQMREKIDRMDEIPFDSDRKLMSTSHMIGSTYTMFTKGAPDVVFGRINRIMGSDGMVRPVSDADIIDLRKINNSLSANGLRVLAFAMKSAARDIPLTVDDEKDLIFIGLIAMIDPPREESRQAVADCRMAGIKPIMITGDHKITATSIAKSIGIFEEGDLSLNGVEVDRLSDDELMEILPNVSVYARVSPENKIRIVELWQRAGQIVAMTGDGVNDAPALKKADIGIAMGITGTEVSKDAASMILTDDNFATIIKAVMNGRSIYSNIKNSIKFLLSGNMSGILAVLYAVIAALPMPFTAVHLLFINLLTDSLPAIAMSMEPANRGLLKDKPRGRSESILSGNFFRDVITWGILIGVFTMISYYIGLGISSAAASTMAFSTLCLGRLFHGFNCRGSQSIVKLGLTTNKFSIFAFLIGLGLLALVLLAPPLQPWFDVVPLPAIDLAYIVLCAFCPTLIIQLVRIIKEFAMKK
ncbi:MAG: calcium-translocating P-type ATPase, PMCA-type [Synergistes sp.]|nr:calcium-translocating P-type ATPase, PMCA-type [Clostridia bacterium]MBQ9882562.1 calcium-translocating P-type ATPase, PMCA-type [Synergistes sp.]